jgi:hypothetical protein
VALAQNLLKIALFFENQVELLSISQSTVHRTRRYFVEYGLSEAIHDDPRSGQPRKLDVSHIERMEHILDLYAEPPNSKRPVINFKE